MPAYPPMMSVAGRESGDIQVTDKCQQTSGASAMLGMQVCEVSSQNGERQTCTENHGQDSTNFQSITTPNHIRSTSTLSQTAKSPFQHPSSKLLYHTTNNQALIPLFNALPDIPNKCHNVRPRG